MQPELTQLTRERRSADPVQYSRSQAPEVTDIFLTKESVRLAAEFADIVEYPNESWATRLSDLRVAVSGESSLAARVAGFSEKTRETSLIGMQELYAQSFDLNPTCALEIGYHLFGEDYKRGEFLANLREAEEPFELGQEQQLPDYLPVLLRLLVQLEDDELRGSLVGHCMIPSLKKIVKAFKEENPFADLISAVQAALELALGEAVDQASTLALESPSYEVSL